MCLGVHTPPCRSRSLAPWQPSGSVGPRPRIPSDSRHLLELGQALLRRGKQIIGCRARSRPCRIPDGWLRLHHSRAQGGRFRTSELALPRVPQAQAPLPYCRATVVGHSCKRPFTDVLLICKNALTRLAKRRSSEAMACGRSPPAACHRSLCIESCRQNCRRPPRASLRAWITADRLKPAEMLARLGRLQSALRRRTPERRGDRGR